MIVSLKMSSSMSEYTFLCMSQTDLFFQITMPKTKTGLKYSKKYTEQNIQRAIEAIRSGMPKKQAAMKFQVPRSTLQFRLSQKFVKSSNGPAPILTSREEEILIEYIEACHRKGFPRRKEDIQHSVREFLEEVPRKNPFKNNMPGDGWYSSFLKRHPTLVNRTAEGVTAASSRVSENDILGWFNLIENYLREKNWFHILSDPSRIYNGDETNFQLCPKSKKVLAPRGARNVYEVERGASKANLTVMFSFSASGLIVPPMIIYPCVRLREEIVDSVPREWGIGRSENGWMKAELFCQYIENIFHPFLVKNNVQLPVILFVDGHSTHLTYNVSQLCTRLDIILIAFYPNSTRILQPADVAAFKPLKTYWKKCVLEWRRENPNDDLNKVRFAPLLAKAVAQVTPQTLSSGFRACGLFPWNPRAIKLEEKCLGKVTKSSKSHVPGDTDTINFKAFKRILGLDNIGAIDSLYRPTEVDMIRKLISGFTNKETNSGYAADPAIKNPHDDESLDVSSASLDNTTSVEKEVVIECSGLEVGEIIDLSQADIVYSNIVELNPSTEGIRDFLTCPDTPVRKGTKNTARQPYIVSSSGWKKIFETKRREKEEVEQKKQERKLERERKKQDDKLRKIKKSIGKENKKNASNITNDVNMNRAVADKIENTEQLNISDSNKIIILQNEVLVSSKDATQLEDPKKPTYVRNIFQQDLKCKESEDIDFKNNARVTNGLCFICVKNLSRANTSIKCFTCRRNYHISCIRKHNNMPPIVKTFYCSSCIKYAANK